MQDLKQNFKFISGFHNRAQVRDDKGLLPNKNWRVDSNINKKIIKPTQIITTCQKSIDGLLASSHDYEQYIEGIKSLGSRKTGPKDMLYSRALFDKDKEGKYDEWNGTEVDILEVGIEKQVIKKSQTIRKEDQILVMENQEELVQKYQHKFIRDAISKPGSSLKQYRDVKRADVGSIEITPKKSECIILPLRSHPNRSLNL